ncbi:conserved hypothetical protein [Talaromyces stipitatus ATCC 10500]|uniref:Cupin type-2 domain-containing protein n=1 Tax=Talaromyces stipitatus (strain ATCC 10500 / CBS 375.48 / QM 6759 / NRRL 1006) TaxID=441959 RepID=B8MSD4_TALSN|nr:uncharacterized protein TSTA_003780 [Talaromyces stipitatus ATCC 10500]EED12321.1 conserved hypothetical protein [Talaromyces stipitatus ATCC 10500]
MAAEDDHNEHGKAVYSNAIAETIPFWPVGSKSDPAGFGLAYTTTCSPVQLNGEIDLTEFVEEHEQRTKGGLVKRGGSVMRFVDYPPHGASPMHRTVSCDYAVVIIGEMECLLDSGERRTLSQGDVLIQRGTMHQWINRSDSWSRMLYVLLDAIEVEINGQRLQEELGDMTGVPNSH